MASPSLFVPAYAYPNPPTLWDAVIVAGPAVRYVVADVNSGPGTTIDANYAAVIGQARAAGIEVLGYVDTNYGAVPAATALADVAAWADLYGITGIFFDQAASAATNLTYYETLATAVHGVAGGLVVLNPGVVPDSGYLTFADVLVIFEGTRVAYETFTVPAWVSATSPDRFVHIVHDVPDEATMLTVLAQARASDAGNVYVTTDATYATLPTFWTTEVAAVDGTANPPTNPGAPGTGVPGPTAGLIVNTYPPPPAGTDWSVMVPGNELWDVVGVFATLTTGTGGPNTATDASGHGNDGTYNVGLFPRNYVPGLVAGDVALTFASAAFPAVNDTSIGFTAVIAGYAVPWSTDMWFRYVSGVTAQRALLSFATLVGPSAFIDVEIDTTANTLRIHDSSVEVARTVAVPALTDGNAHHIAVTWDGVATATFYVDGVSVAIVVTNPHGFQAAPYDDNGIGTGGPNDLTETLDEVAIYGVTLSAGRIAAHHAAGAAGFAAYSAAVLADGPELYYHLDDTVSTGRTPTLIVSDGTHTVEAIGQGFAAPTSPGPYAYSWQPKVSANTVTPAGTAISVATAPLVVPAGYILETVTPDIAPTDQWSNIAVWWSTDIMNASGGFNPYAYPPGARLVYQPPRT